MRLLVIFALLVLIITGTIFAACIPTERFLYVPAVANENRSEMVKIGVETKAGTGEVFVSVTPAVGFYTQESERTASDIAFAVAKKKECDVFLRVLSQDGVNQVDGPSAGAAITIMLISALRSEQLRNDFSITGTIEEDGTVGDVGGIPLKAEAVAKLGKKLFIVPTLSKGDLFGVLLVKKYYNLTVIEAEDIEAAYNLALSNKMPDERLVLKPEPETAFNQANLSHPYTESFANVSKSLIEEAKSLTKNAELGYLANFESRLQSAISAYDKSQYYTAANIAFLLVIDNELAEYSPDKMRKEIENVNSCLSSFKQKDLTIENFELIGPAQIRYLWAKKKLPPVPQQHDFVAAEFSIYESALMAKSWCDAATQMNEYPQSGQETAFNAELISPYAKDLLGYATKALKDSEDEDLKWHLEVAKDAYDTGLYVASTIDSNYVLSSIETGKVEVNETDGLIRQYSNASYKYLWPQLFQNHAKNFDNDKKTAVRMLLFASKINDSFEAIERIARLSTGANLTVTSENLSQINAINSTQAGEAQNQSGSEEELSVIFIAAFLVIIALAIREKLKNRRKKKH